MLQKTRRKKQNAKISAGSAEKKITIFQLEIFCE